MAVPANGLGSLKQVLELCEVRIGIAVIHQGVQKFRGFPHALLATLETEIFFFFLKHVIDALILMI